MSAAKLLSYPRLTLKKKFTDSWPGLGWTYPAVLLVSLVALPLLSIAVAGAQVSHPSPTAVQEVPLPLSVTGVPKSELDRPTVSGEPTEVAILLYILDIDKVDSAEQSFAATVFYEARWKVPLLAHQGPGPLYRRLTEVWTPRLIIINQQMVWPAFPGVVEVYPDGEVVFRQKVWGKFSQPLELHDFPFDRQRLSIQIAAVGLLENEVKMVPLVRAKGRQSGLASQFSLPDWEVLSWQAEPMPYIPFEGQPGIAGFTMQIEIGRRVLYWVTKVIVPLCLIVMMSWIPLWIDPEQVGTNIGIAATSFLTLVAYLFAISVLLPPVSYVTRMDWFIFLSTLIVFAGLVHAVFNAILVKKGKTVLAERIDRWSRGAYPLVLMIVLPFSFVL